MLYNICPRCEREVYGQEEVVALDRVWHSFCFSCILCHKLLNLCTVKPYCNELYCGDCYQVIRDYAVRTGKKCNKTKSTQKSPDRKGDHFNAQGSEDSLFRMKWKSMRNEDEKCQSAIKHQASDRVNRKGCLKENCQGQNRNQRVFNNENVVINSSRGRNCKSCQVCKNKEYYPGHNVCAKSEGVDAAFVNKNKPHINIRSAVFYKNMHEVKRLHNEWHTNGKSCDPYCRSSCTQTNDQNLSTVCDDNECNKKIILCRNKVCKNKKTQYNSSPDNNATVDGNVLCEHCGKIIKKNVVIDAENSTALAKFVGNKERTFKSNSFKICETHLCLVTCPRVVSQYYNRKHMEPLDNFQKFAKKSLNFGPGVCVRCDKKVYFAEKKHGAGGVYHDCCFSCYMCLKPLNILNLETHRGEIFCKLCHTKHFGPRGYGFGLHPVLYNA